MNKTNWTVEVTLENLPPHVPLPGKFLMHLHMPFETEAVPGNPAALNLVLDVKQLRVTAPDLFGDESMTMAEFKRRLNVIVNGTELPMTYKVSQWHLDDGSVRTFDSGLDLRSAISRCEYQADVLSERLDYIVVRSGNEWLATATREGERSYVFWISEEMPG